MIHQVLVSHLVGGAGLVAIRLATSGMRRGFDTCAWVPCSGPATEVLGRSRVAWRTYGLDQMRGNHFRHLLACGRMLPGLIGRRRPVVHVHNPVVYRFLRPVLSAAQARVIVHFQIEPTSDEIEWTMRYPPDHVVACAKYIGARLERVFADRGLATPVASVPNAADTARFVSGSTESARAELRLVTTRFVVVLVANLSPHKGQTTAIRAMQVLKARGKEVECWLVGEDRTVSGSHEGELRALSAALGVEDRVRFLGFRSDTALILRAADVAILPSTHEGLPLSLVEAQATCLPVVGSPIPGILEVIQDGKTGLVAAADDVIGYADRIELLHDSPELRRRLGHAARKSVEGEFTWERLEERIFSIYASLS